MDGIAGMHRADESSSSEIALLSILCNLQTVLGFSSRNRDFSIKSKCALILSAEFGDER